MTTQQFFKGLMMMLVTVIVSAFSQQPIDYLLLAVTAASTILTYSGKNLVAVLHSDSPVGSLSWINLASGLLVAIGAGILESVGLYLIEGAILWDIVWKVVLASAFTYLGTTFFAPQHSVAKVRGFISPATSRSLRKASMMLVLLFAIGIGASAQRSPWDGFTKKITPQLVADNAKAPLTGTSLFRFDVGLILCLVSSVNFCAPFLPLFHGTCPFCPLLIFARASSVCFIPLVLPANGE